MLADLIDWMLRTSPPATQVEAFWGAVCEKLVEAGVPLSRAASAVYAIHPEVWVKGLVWRRGHGAESATIARGLSSAPGFRVSPIARLEQTPELRCRLEPPAVIEFAELREQAAKGATDYLIQLMSFSDGRATYVSWMSDRPGGFTDEDLAVLRGIRSVLALRLELSSAHVATRGLLDVYLGTNAAQRVLAGAIERGRGESIHAAIWWCDLRGFTALGDRYPVRDVIALLDRYFEAVAGPVLDGGGEILKFIGDAMLAIFPGELAVAKPHALAAAVGALAALDELNIQLADERQPPLAIGIALHEGDVMFGNIGARTRLDFTAIGAPVNEVCRVESLCRPLGVPLLVSAAFAEGLLDLVSLGPQSIEGKREPIEVFTLPRYVPRTSQKAR